MNHIAIITALSLSVLSVSALAAEQHGTAAGHFAGDIDSKQKGKLKKIGEDTSANGAASRADEAKTDKAIIFQNEGQTDKGADKGIIIHKQGQEAKTDKGIIIHKKGENPKTEKAIIFQNEGNDTKQSTLK